IISQFFPRKLKKKMAEGSRKFIKLKIKAQDDTILHFKVNPSTIMKDIFMSYSSKKQMMNYKVFRFFFDGKRLSPKKTVNELGLKNGDEIDAMIHQDGGGSACNY
ncbi:hypothetical protein AABB24_016472, partial [Solanum stoloniferum]